MVKCLSYSYFSIAKLNFSQKSVNLFLGEKSPSIRSGRKGSNGKRYDGPNVGRNGSDAEASAHVSTGKGPGLHGVATETERSIVYAESGIVLFEFFPHFLFQYNCEHRDVSSFVLIFQIAKLQEKEAKLTREVERLRGHLLQIEDGYTQEAIAAEEREKELRNRLAAAEEKALSSTHAVHAARY